jgi:DNA-binding PadR family transcriptional regulator
MIRNKSEILRFGILKLLQESPTHGYDLFLILKEQNKVKQASDLYKILRSMKKKGLINGKVEEDSSFSGPKKTILSLSEEGIDAYYEYVLESAKIFMDLFMDLSMSQINLFKHELFEQFEINTEKLGNNIYFDISLEMPIRFQIGAIKQICNFLDTNITLYLQMPKDVDQRMFRSLENDKVNLQIFDKNMRLKSHTIDSIFSLGGSSKEIFNSKLNNFIDLLKQDGALFLIIRNPERLPRLNRFQFMFQDIFINIPKKFHKRFKEIFPFPQLDVQKVPNKLLNMEQIKDILQNNFEDLKFIKIAPIIGIFIAQKSKETNKK